MRVAATALAVLLLGLGAGCGDDADEGDAHADGTTRDDSCTSPAARTWRLLHREMPFADDTPTAAVTSLLEGASAAEADAGLGTTIPEGTTLNGIEVEDGIATVDLSGEFDDGGGSAGMFMRLAQIVHTVTQTQTVTGVRFGPTASR